MPAKRLNFPILDEPRRSNHLTVISCGYLDLIMTSQPITLPASHQDAHAQYEFLIPLTCMPHFYLGNHQINCQPGLLIPINPTQLHGIRHGRKLISFISVFYEREWLERLIRKIKGNASQGFPAEALELQPDVQALLSQMIVESQKTTPCRAFLMDNLAEQLAILIIRYYYKASTTPEMINPDLLTGEQGRFRTAISLMHHQYCFPLTIKQLAESTGMNNFYFIRSFKRLFSISPYNFLMQIRLVNAKRLLTQSNLLIADISRQCGFQSASRFSAAFQKDTGQTPSQYRRASRQCTASASERQAPVNGKRQ